MLFLHKVHVHSDFVWIAQNYSNQSSHILPVAYSLKAQALEHDAWWLCRRTSHHRDVNWMDVSGGIAQANEHNTSTYVLCDTTAT